jgi:hypothetical protein
MIVRADALRIPLADGSVDLVIGSPPYGPQRTYGINAGRTLEAWVEWMLAITEESLRVSRGLVLWVVSGWTAKRKGVSAKLGGYQPGPEGLLWEWVRRGGECWAPNYWHRFGIPGSGHKVWYRRDVEYVLAFKRPGDLPYADPVANGHKPRWPTSGRTSNRGADGKRQKPMRDPDGSLRFQYFKNPEIADPGNLFKTMVGKHHMGNDLAHQNEAPYPVAVPLRFIASHCPPRGLVLDPFGGSGSTAQAAMELGRRYVASDLRLSQCELTRRRVATVTPSLPFGAPS